MIDIILDGFYCKKCKEMHPTLFWHEKYNDYETKDIEEFKKKIQRFGSFPNEIEYITKFKESLAIKGLEKCDELGYCYICNYETFFKSTRSGHFICSNECKYKDNNIKNSMD